jgi:hypothetical protein|tara:strand:+ start:689 stop:919 length:231 start_codon:yes stop_codon:yes gene_type:complete
MKEIKPEFKIDVEAKKVNILKKMAEVRNEKRANTLKMFTVGELSNNQTVQSLRKRLVSIDFEFTSHYDWFLNPLKQ